MLIGQLKIENFELKQQERDYGKLHGQLLDSQHYFKLLQDEKIRLERDSKEREDILQKKVENIQDDMKRLNDTLSEKHEQLKMTDAELIAGKQRIEERNKEIARMRTELSQSGDETKRVLGDKKEIEEELGAAIENNKNAQAEIDSLTLTNEKYIKANKEALDKAREDAIQISKLEQKGNDLIGQNELLKRNLSMKEQELEATHEARRASQREAESLLSKCNQLEDEKQDLLQKQNDLENEVNELKKNLDDTLSMVDLKDSELAETHDNLRKTEERALSAEGELMRVKKENEGIQMLLAKYKEDLEAHRKSKEDLTLKKYEIEQENKKLERELLSKDLEARTAKRELEKSHDTQGRLIDGHYQLNQELEALKEHTSVL